MLAVWETHALYFHVAAAAMAAASRVQVAQHYEDQVEQVSEKR
jgi:hypothetical protein